MKRLAAGVGVSTAVHAAAGGLLLWFLAGDPPLPIVAELDLSMGSLLPSAASSGGGTPARLESWREGPKIPKETAPPPSPPAAEPEPGGSTGGDATATAGAGGNGPGGYFSVANVARKPVWVANRISASDYPYVARQKGRDGRVVVAVWIGVDGGVVDVRLLEGAYEALNDVALRKVKGARFTPARDASGRAVPCRVALPILFELR